MDQAMEPTIFQCKRCFYTTKYKISIRGHLTRKTPCQVSVGGEDIPIDVLLNDVGKFRTRVPNYTCSFCNRSYTCQSGFSRHKKSCKGIGLQNNQLPTSIVQKIEETLINVEKRVETALGKLQQPTTNIGNVNIIQGNVNIIQVNAHGKEDTSYIPTHYVTECVKNLLDGGVNNYLENIYCHPKHPENHNIRGTSKKQNIFEVYDGINWRLTHANTVLDNLIQKGCKVFYNHLMRNMNEEEDIREVIEKQLRDLTDVNKKRKSVDYYKIRRNLFFMFFQEKPNDLVLVIEPDGQDIVETMVDAIV